MTIASAFAAIGTLPGGRGDLAEVLLDQPWYLEGAASPLSGGTTIGAGQVLSRSGTYSPRAARLGHSPDQGARLTEAHGMAS